MVKDKNVIKSENCDKTYRNGHVTLTFDLYTNREHVGSHKECMYYNLAEIHGMCLSEEKVCKI